MINYHIEVTIITQNKFPISITLKKATIDIIDQGRGTMKRSHYIEQILEESAKAIKEVIKEDAPYNETQEVAQA
jgi:hypothetical protein